MTSPTQCFRPTLMVGRKAAIRVISDPSESHGDYQLKCDQKRHRLLGIIKLAEGEKGQAPAICAVALCGLPITQGMRSSSEPLSGADRPRGRNQVA